MNILEHHMEQNNLVIPLRGRIDSLNAPDTEIGIEEACRECPSASLILDLSGLEYISSAGLRVLMRLRQKTKDVRLINVTPSIYELLELTGFTELMPVQKMYRVISLEGCVQIGSGANGKVYRIDPETIVKVYRHPDALPEIQRERELARTAFILGIPTAIPYDTVRIKEGGYGSVFELLDAKSYLDLLKEGSMSAEDAARRSAELLRTIHSKTVRPGTIPDMKETALSWAASLNGRIPEEEHHRLTELIRNIPVDLHMLHGDFYVKNIMLQGIESLLIDMDTLCHGHPVFELGSIYNAYVGFYETAPEDCGEFLGISAEEARNLWDLTLRDYLCGQKDPEDVEKKAALLGHVRLLRRAFRRNEEDSPKGRKAIENSRKQISRLLKEVDTLVF